MPSMVDITLDLSHTHGLRGFSDWRGFSWLWHDPGMPDSRAMLLENGGTLLLPKTGVVCISEWQKDRLWERLRVKSAVCDIIMVDEATYRYDAAQEPSGRWLCVGIVDWQKGALETALMIASLPSEALDIIGPPTEPARASSLREMERQTGGRIRYHGEVSEAKKLTMMKAAKGLLFLPQYPDTWAEAHSMKMVEALCCGTPCLALSRGAIPEIFAQQLGVQLFDSTQEMKASLSTPFVVDREYVSALALSRWSSEAALSRVEALMNGG